MMLLTQCLVMDITRSFERQFAKGVPMVVKFYADWCMDCKLIDEPYDQMSNSFTKKQALIAELDCTQTNETYEFCIKHGIKTFPTVKIFNGAYGDQMYQKAITSQYELKNWVQQNLQFEKKQEL